MWGQAHKSTLGRVNDLGILYACLGMREDDEAMYRRALEGYENALGPDHILTLDTVNHKLGVLYKS